jgi:hypothetical protein
LFNGLRSAGALIEINSVNRPQILPQRCQWRAMASSMVRRARREKVALWAGNIVA